MVGANLKLGGNGIHHSSIILIDLGGKVYALSFGSAYMIAKKLWIERKFGKTVVGNGKLPDEVRGLRANVTGPYGKSRSERRGKGGPTGVLEVPRNAPMLGGVAAKVNLVSEHIADGSIGVRSIAPTSIEDLVQILDQLEEWWDGGIETDPVLKAYDKIEEETDLDRIKQLSDNLSQVIATGDATQFSLALDSDELWHATSHEYRVQVNGNYQWLSVQLDVQSMVTALQQAIQAGNDPFETRLRSHVPPDKDVESILIDHLSYDHTTQIAGSQFIFESGAWYEYTPTWAATLQNDIQLVNAAKTSLLPLLGLPAFNAAVHKDEDGYIEKAVLALGGRAVKCHKEFPTGQPKLELCDILIDGKYLLYIKSGTGWSACSEAAHQGTQAANALIDHAAFRQWAETKFFTPNGWTLDIEERKELTLIVLLINCKPARVPTKLFIRAKDVVCSYWHDIRKLGYQAGVIAV